MEHPGLLRIRYNRMRYTLDATAKTTGRRIRMLDKEAWIPVKEKLPKRNGDYLVISNSPICRRIVIASFAKNLEKVDKYAFQFRGKKRPGWYEYDCDWGCIEYDNVTHWLPLPEMPEIRKK